MVPEIREIVASSILTPQKVGSLSGYYDYSLNPYAGCAFKCSYCYVPKFPNSHGREHTDWGGWVDVKVNAPELIQRDRLKVFGARLFFSSATDPYQYLELKYRLSRRCLEQLLLYKPAKVTMHTRSHLMLQDIDLLKAFGSSLSVGVSLTTDDEKIRREFEPNAPSIARRLELIKTLREAGIDVYISMAPLLPCDPGRLAALIAPHVDRVWVDTMRWTEVNTRPELIQKYASHFLPENHERTIALLKSLFAAERERLKSGNPPSGRSGMRKYSEWDKESARLSNAQRNIKRGQNQPRITRSTPGKVDQDAIEAPVQLRLSL